MFTHIFKLTILRVEVLEDINNLKNFSMGIGVFSIYRVFRDYSYYYLLTNIYPAYNKFFDPRR